MKKPVLTGLLVVAILAVAALSYQWWRQAGQTPESFVQSGQSYLQQQRYPEAAIQFRNALQLDASHRQARYELALTLLEQGRPAEAARELRRLLEYHPDDVEALLRLGNLYLVSGAADPQFFQQAQRIAQEILELQPDSVPALILSGNAAAGLQDHTEASRQLDRALRLEPENVAALVSLGTSRFEQQDLAEAERFFLRARQVEPGHKGNLLSLANLYIAKGEPDRAAAAFDQAAQLYPTDPEVYLSQATFYWQQGQPETCERILREVQDQLPDNPEPLLALLSLVGGENRDKGVQLVEELQQHFPLNLAVSKRLAAFFLDTDVPRARALIDQALSQAPRDLEARLLLGQAQLIQGENEAARATFSLPELLNSGYPQPDFFLGNIALQAGNLEEAARHYRNSLLRDSRYLPARIALSDCLLRRGEVEDARVEISRLKAASPQDLQVRILDFRLDLFDENFPEADAKLKSLLAERPRDATLQLHAGLYQQARGRPREAERHLLASIEIDPASVDAIRELTQFYVAQKRFAAARDLLGQVQLAPPVEQELTGQIEFNAGQLESAAEAYTRSIAMAPERLDPYLGLAGVLIQQQRLDEASQTLNMALARDPSFAPAHTLRGLIFLVQGRLPEARSEYEQALVLDPAIPSAANNLANIISLQGGDLGEALKWAQAARKLDPDNPDYADTLGWVLYQRGSYVLALAQLEFAASRKPGDPTVQYHLGETHLKLNQPAAAAAAFRRALASQADFPHRKQAEAALEALQN